MKRNLQYTPSTAHKRSFHAQQSTKFQFSPILQTPSNRRNCNNFSSKIQSLRSTIDDLIETISEKKSIQKSAVLRVWDVNSQLCDSLSHNNQVAKPMSVRTTIQHTPQDFHKNSVFGQASTYIEHRNSPFEQNYYDEQQQTLKIKQALNNEMRSTNQLMNQLKKLQRQHQYLRSHSNVRQNLNDQFEVQENRRLKQQLRRLNMNSAPQYTVDDLWREFCELKEENHKLRQETIAMLKNDKSDQKFYNQNNLYSTCAY